MRKINQAEAEALPFIAARAPDGSMGEREADHLDQAIDPVYFDDDGWRMFFDAGQIKGA
jgi:hypothetical protein